MNYENIKQSLGKVFNSTPVLRIMFYKLLDILFLRAWYINRELRTLAKSNKKLNIMDAGSGYGQYSYRLAKILKDSNIRGFDLKEEQVNDCNNFFKNQKLDTRVTFEYKDLATIDIPNEFDLILSVDVMEHIEDDVTVMKNLYSSLKKGGLLLLSTPSDYSANDEENNDASFNDDHVRDGYNINDLRQKLKTAGFNKIEIIFSYATPGKIAWKLSMKWPMIVLNSSKIFFILLPFYYLLVYPLVALLNYFDIKTRHKAGNGLIAKAWK